MSFPELLIDRAKLKHNIKTLLEMTAPLHIQTHFVTKCVCAYRPIVEAMNEAGAEYFADSRVENLASIQDIGMSHMLVRMPMISDAMNVVRHADLSLNSDMATIEALSDAALALEREHGVILMVEMGDLREGFMPDEIMETASRVLNLRGVWLAGIGVNFNCYGGVIPETHQLEELVTMAKAIRQRFGIPLPIVSGGNTGSLYLIKEGSMPEGITHLRIGEAYLIGIETSYRRPIGDMYNDVFTLRAEIIELRNKPSVPEGLIGPNSFNEIPVFEDKGQIWRAILAVGEQDTKCETLIPKDGRISFLGSSSDHMLLDVTHALRDFKVGDVLEFTPDYAALLRAMTSPYVTKRMV
ncbi:MAG: alanine/ornithine racemase family PLP-dependent enzyme [Clostridiales bacterium]|nr:alanine/ornithine racemase family PLP-dependent enzyme [Clostridiales bacterium]MDD2571937.1 alanine/ornithine racemase family PLP-dependent enzyme [Eubacteriales bacterium]MDD3540521.1 alanine/ornithine racemase family PLP-dependent enzyme [Eubacteriales bacterium]